MIPEPMAAARRALSERYLEGSGIEVGALHQPLWTNERATVRYVDRLDIAGLRQQYPELGGCDLVDVDVIDDGEVLASVEDGQFDFIIANHMLEHTENPIGTIRNHLRKIRERGILYYAVPDKSVSFDRDRPITPFEHLVRDDREGPAVSRLEHFYEWVRLVERVDDPDEIERRIQRLISTNYSIHFHVWDESHLKSFFEGVNSYLDSSFRIEYFGRNFEEVIAILRKSTGKTARTMYKIHLDHPGPGEAVRPGQVFDGWTISPDRSESVAITVNGRRAESRSILRPDVEAAFPGRNAKGFKYLFEPQADVNDYDIGFRIGAVEFSVVCNLRLSEQGELEPPPEHPTPIERERLRGAFALFEAARGLIGLDTSRDPYHKIFHSFIEEANRRPAGRILEIGSRARSGNICKDLFRNYREYIGLDIVDGENVDVVGDIHRLSRYFDEEKFDFVYSVSTFEHLAMPWRAVLEINKVMATGGWLYIATHPTWPPHERPWDFWRFSEEGFQVLLNPVTGFEILECSAGLPCSIVPFGHEPAMTGLCEQPANLGISVIARKIGPSDRRLAWDVDVSEILDTTYPSSRPPGA